MKYTTVRKSCLPLFLLSLSVLFTPFSHAVGEEIGATVLEKDTSPPEEYAPGEPFLATGSYFLGYRFVSQEDSLKAAEYVYPDSSVTFGINMLSAPLPYRYHLNAEYLSKYDFYGDAGFAYKDILLFRDILVGLHHNLDHFNYLYPGEPAAIIYNDLNLDDDYSLNYTSNLATLRLKTPNFPFHTFFKQRYVGHDGLVEQRFLLGDFANVIKTSKSRDIDWRSNAYTLGANSHLGPIEVEYAFDHDELDPQGDNILYDQYPVSESFSRPADVYPHNVIPETESTANSLKVHTSYTGGIVAAATLANLNNKNNYSQTESSVWKGAVDFSWIPDPVIGLFLKYRHRDVDMDTPDYVTLAGLTNTLRYPVRQGISYNKDIFSLSARYKPLGKLTLIPSYEFTRIDKENIDEWQVLQDQSTIHTINVTAHAKPFNTLKLKAIYEYQYFDNPIYNTDPSTSNELRLNATYMPLLWMNIYLDYLLVFTDRDDLRFLNNDPLLLLEGGERDGRRDRLFASVAFMLSPTATVTTSWAYNRWNVDQDLLYGKWNVTGGGDLPYVDAAVPYTDESNSFTLGCQYIPRTDITLNADLTYTLSDGEYVPGTVLTDSPSTLIFDSKIESAETILSVGISKKMFTDWEVGVKFYTDVYDDKADSLMDGQLFITTFSIKRYF